MELHIKERLLLPTFLPKEGSFMDFNLKKSIIKKVAISEDDKVEYSIIENQEERRIEWDVTKDAEKPLTVDFSKEEMDYLKCACEAISEQKLPDEIWVIVERIYNAAQG